MVGHDLDLGDLYTDPSANMIDDLNQSALKMADGNPAHTSDIRSSGT